MAITDQQAIPYGWLALCAEDMYSDGALNPPPDARIAKSGWSILGILTAMDALIPVAGAPNRKLAVDLGKRVFYGFLARSQSDPAQHVVAIRGTEGIVEWAIDAEFAPIPHPAFPQAQVEQGFWGVYQTMSLADPATGATTHQSAAEGVAALVGGGGVVVAGHSLGAALATYFASALALRMPNRVRACLFASPRTGDAAWTAIFDQHVADYRLFNYLLDIVPHVPVGIGYSTLSKATVIEPANAQAGISLDLFCNHHLVDYCAMIDYAQEQAAELSRPDASADKCILGPADKVPETAKALAVLIKDFGLATQAAVSLLKSLHWAKLV